MGWRLFLTIIVPLTLILRNILEVLSVKHSGTFCVSHKCYPVDVCDFEEGSCKWEQQTTDDADWVRQSGPTLNLNTGPDSDHTTSTPSGHYYYLPSSAADSAGKRATMFSPLYPAGENISSVFNPVLLDT